jgi:hypothetical protein
MLAFWNTETGELRWRHCSASRTNGATSSIPQVVINLLYPHGKIILFNHQLSTLFALYRKGRPFSEQNLRSLKWVRLEFAEDVC